MTKFRSVADTANFILITPNGTVISGWGQAWNCFTSNSTVDDVLFVSDMIDYLTGQYNIDTTRVYSSGFSNGGIMGYDLACQLSNRIAAVASVAGSMEVARLQACNPEKVISILEIHGTSDPFVPFNGGINGGIILAAVDSVLKFWRNYDQCSSTPIITDIPNINTTDGSTVKRFVWPNCTGGTSVELLRVIFGGHTWPGLSFGSTNRDIIADQEIWRFFLKHKLNTTTNTADSPDLHKWRVFPNPVFGVLNLDVPQGTGNLSVCVVDVLGKTVLQRAFLSASAGQVNLDLNGIADGIYFLSIESDGKQPLTQKIIVRRD